MIATDFFMDGPNGAVIKSRNTRRAAFVFACLPGIG